MIISSPVQFFSLSIFIFLSSSLCVSAKGGGESSTPCSMSVIFGLIPTSLYPLSLAEKDFRGMGSVSKVGSVVLTIGTKFARVRILSPFL